MAIYYVEATGSNEYPFSSRATAAISLYELFDALYENGIYDIATGDTVYVNGAITEPDDYGWYGFNGGSLIGGSGSSVDSIDLSSGTLYADVGGIVVRDVLITTTSSNAYSLIYCDGNIDIARCRLNGNNYAYYAIYCYGRLSQISMICNTFEDFTVDEYGNSVIYISDSGSPEDDFVGTGQVSRSYTQMAVSPSNDIYVVDRNYSYIYLRIAGSSTFTQLPITQRNWMGGLARASNGDLYATTQQGIYKQTGGSGDFIVIQDPLGTISDALQLTAVAVAQNGDVYITNGSIRLPAGSRTYGIWKQTGGLGMFASLGVTERYWMGITVDLSGNIYACESNGDIYKSTDEGANFIPLGQTYRLWRHMFTAPNGDIYAIVQNGKLYVQRSGVGDFEEIFVSSRNYFGVCVDYNGDIYASVSGGDIMIFTLGGEDISLDCRIIANSFNNVRPIDINYRFLNFDSFYFLNNAISFVDGPSGLGLSIYRCNITDFQSSHNILENPGFLGTAPDPLKIDDTSPCYTTGLFSSYATSDILGNSYRNPPSIGAYEVVPDLIVDFVGDPLSGGANLTVQFTDQSLGTPTSWDWDFGDGSTHSTEQNPIHVYTVAGTYSVTLVASNDEATDTETKTDYITVNMTADFTSDVTEGTAALTVQFTDTSRGQPTSWDWDFGDGSPHSTEQNPIHEYAVAGSFTVTLIASNSFDSDTEIKTNYVWVYFSADFEGIPRVSYLDSPVQFLDLSSGTPLTWLWNFGDGSDPSTLQNPSHVYRYEGLYTVTLTISRGLSFQGNVIKEDYIRVLNSESGTGFVRYLGPTLIFD
jgi:PKD repeat protein